LRKSYKKKSKRNQEAKQFNIKLKKNHKKREKLQSVALLQKKKKKKKIQLLFSLVLAFDLPQVSFDSLKQTKLIFPCDFGFSIRLVFFSSVSIRFAYVST